MSSPVPEFGSLAGESLPELLWSLHEGDITGALQVRLRAVRKTIYFEDGRIRFARSNNRDDRLGEFLLRRGVITVKQFLASARLIAPGKRQGTILCAMGAISPDELVRHVTDQVTEILYSLFGWSDGEFEVQRGPSDAEERIALSIPIEDVILSGIRRVGEWSRIWEGVGGSLETVFVARPKAAGLSYRAALTEDEAGVLALINGKLDVGRLLEVSYSSNFDTARTLWALRVVRAIEPLATAAVAPGEGEDYALAEQVEEFDRVFTFVHGFVTERIGDLVDHFMDRVAAIAAGRHPDVLAEIHLRNQGRVEYEQILANLSGSHPEARRDKAQAALREILSVMVVLTAKELGPEEKSYLCDQLRLLARDVPAVAVESLLEARDEAAPPL